MIDRLQFAQLPFGMGVRTTTLIMSAVVFGAVLWQTRRPGLAFTVLAAWISSYELVYVFTGFALQRWAFTYAIASTGGLGWVLLALVLGHRPQPAWLAVFAMGWLLWIVAGFHANDHAHIVSALQEGLNVGTKTALGLAYAFGGRWASRSASNSGQGSIGPVATSNIRSPQ